MSREICFVPLQILRKVKIICDNGIDLHEHQFRIPLWIDPNDFTADCNNAFNCKNISGGPFDVLISFFNLWSYLEYFRIPCWRLERKLCETSYLRSFGQFLSPGEEERTLKLFVRGTQFC